MSEKDQYILLIQKKLSGEISDEELSQLEKIKNYSRENEELYSKYLKLLEKINPAQPPVPFNSEAGWSDISERLDLNNIAAPSLKKLNYYWYSAAATIIAFAAAFIYYIVVGSSVVNIESGINKTKKIILPDKSVVILNRSSEIEYDWDENTATRKVKLEGEAFFSVEKDSKPFIVETKNSSVNVLGTKFNVQSKNTKTTLAVSEGRVLFYNLQKPEETRVLQKNEISFCNNSNIPTAPVKVNADSVLVWHSRKFKFVNAGIEQILSELQRAYHFEFELKLEKNSTKTLSASYNNQELELILETICKAMDIKVEEKNGVYYLSDNIEQ